MVNSGLQLKDTQDLEFFLGGVLKETQSQRGYTNKDTKVI